MHCKQKTRTPAPYTPAIMPLAEYLGFPQDYRSVWTTQRDDLAHWAKVAHLYMGQRTLLRDGSLWVEGISFVIKEEDSGWYQIVGEPGQYAWLQGLKAAIKAAADFVYLPTQHVQRHESLLRDSGRVAWSYGFCTVRIQLVSSLG
ncbi:hypothetical protein [Paracidovorax citrulli]|uniref:hypothetical protein n=1 Tax=Paracidovorax citrulli TaxID=80869 RepID=UPI003FA6928C